MLCCAERGVLRKVFGRTRKIMFIMTGEKHMHRTFIVFGAILGQNNERSAVLCAVTWKWVVSYGRCVCVCVWLMAQLAHAHIHWTSCGGRAKWLQSVQSVQSRGGCLTVLQAICSELKLWAVLGLPLTKANCSECEFCSLNAFIVVLNAPDGYERKMCLLTRNEDIHCHKECVHCHSWTHPFCGNKRIFCPCVNHRER